VAVLANATAARPYWRLGLDLGLCRRLSPACLQWGDDDWWSARLDPSLVPRAHVLPRRASAFLATRKVGLPAACPWLAC